MGEIVELGARVEERRPYEILYRTAPYWRVPLGEHAGGRYPEDYPGRITSVAPVGRKTKGGKPKSFGRSAARHAKGVTVMQLTDEEASLAGARRLKVKPSPEASAPKLEPVTFEDRWGAIAPELSGMRAILEDETLATSEKPIDRERVDFARRFALALAGELPQVEVHSGAGYYRVDNQDSGKTDTVSGTPVKDDGTSTITLVTGGLTTNAERGKRCVFDTSENVYVVVSNTAETLVVNGDASGEAADDGVTIDSFETWQSALDKLYAEQGGAELTAEQVVEGFDGTYTEHVAPPGLLTTPAYHYKIRAAAGNSNVVITADDTAHTLSMPNARCILVEGIEFDHTGGTSNWCVSPGLYVTFKSCTIKWHWSGGYPMRGHGTFLDCFFDYDVVANVLGYSSTYYQCRFKNARPTPYWGGINVFKSCAFTGGGIYGVFGTAGDKATYVLQCTFYNCGIRSVGSHFLMRDTIIERADGGLPLQLDGQELIESDHNCIHTSGANLIQVDGTYYSFAQWQALGQGAHSLDEDPKLTNPAGGDFSLQSDSPCRRKGAGAAVEKDKAGSEFDRFNPDMGAYSTGSGIPSEPAVESVAASGTAVTVTVSGEAGATMRARLLKDDGAVDDEGSRSGSGDVSLTSSEESAFRTVLAWSEHEERARSKAVCARPPRYFLSGGASTDEIASGIVSALEGSPALAALLGSSDAVYLAHPPKDACLPCLVYELDLIPIANGVEGELRLSSWAKTAAEARQVMEEAENVLQAGRFETLNYVVRRPLVREADAGFDGSEDLRYEREKLSFRAYRK